MEKKRLPPLAAHPWSYNPSSWSQRIQIGVGALVAALIALYLGLYQWRVIGAVWDPVFGDGTIRVLDSDVSHQITSWIRVPDAILGVFAYLSDVVFALAGSERRWQDRPWLVILFGIDVIPLGAVSIVLVLLQGIAVKAWCFLCLITAAISLVLILLSYDEVYTSLLYLYEIWKKTGSFRLVWKALWGVPSMAAYEAGLAIAEREGDGGKMWARIAEIMIAIWMVRSRWIFAYETGWSDVGLALVIGMLSGLSFVPRLNKMHLLQVLPAGWMLYVSFSYPTPILPFALQNYVVTALLLLMFAPIPSWASDHPRPWQKFLKDHNLP